MQRSRSHNLKIGSPLPVTYSDAVIECTSCGVTTQVKIVDPLPDEVPCPVCGAVMERVTDTTVEVPA